MSVGAVVVRREVVMDVIAPVHACVEDVKVHFVVGEFDELVSVSVSRISCRL